MSNRNQGLTKRQQAEFIRAAHAVGRHGLTLASSGNLSWRIDQERMLITATSCWKSELNAAQIAVCRLSDGASLNGVKPSVETGFHRGILLQRPDVNVVLHFQSPNATTLACSRRLNLKRFFVIPEIPFYLGPIAAVPYKDPGSALLAQAVIRAMRRHNMIILRNHGEVTAGRDFQETLQRAIFFEFACGIVLRTGPHLRPMSSAAVTSLFRRAARESASKTKSV
jgi:ribulose-5-phosphate 4-epimerase/fuculose-1-phosphate aldolase